MYFAYIPSHSDMSESDRDVDTTRKINLYHLVMFWGGVVSISYLYPPGFHPIPGSIPYPFLFRIVLLLVAHPTAYTLAIARAVRGTILQDQRCSLYNIMLPVRHCLLPLTLRLLQKKYYTNCK